LVLHLPGMPTKHARIALTRDQELDAALKAAAPILGPSKPAATLARELVLRGAKAVLDDPNAELDRWLNERGGVTRATVIGQERRELLARVREMAKDLPPGPPMSEILDELRADRI
jgi:hypothetical protein